MMTKLSVPFLVFSIVAFSTLGCSSSNSGGGTGGATGGGGATGNDGATDTGGVNVAALCPATPTRNAATAAMTAAEFCQLYLQACNNPNDGGFTSQASCETAYTALMFESTRQCRSYHLCNAAIYVSGGLATHCPHAVGLNGVCGDTNPDASTGN